MLKYRKLKTRSIKTKKPLVEHKSIADFNLQLTASNLLPVFTESAPEVERNKIKYCAKLENSPIFPSIKYIQSDSRH